MGARLGGVVAVVGAFMAGGCDSVERAFDGVAAPLKEPELPNCSKVLTCCANLSGDINFLSTDYFWLQPGANDITIVGGSANVLWQNAWG